MLAFIKKNRTALLTISLVLSLSVNIHFLFDSRIKKDIIHGLEQKNDFLDSQNKESKKKEKSYLIEIKEKKKAIAATEKKLAESIKKHKRLKVEMADLRKPENPRSFKSLKECKEKYATLQKDFTLSLEFGKETELSLNLCMEKSKEQQDVIILTENAYKECQKQGKLKDLKIENHEKAFNDLDRFYKRKWFKRGIFYGTVGAAIGVVITYFLLKKR